MPTLPEPARALLDRPEHAVVATVEPSGQPQLSVIWVKRDGDDVLFSTIRGRRKTDNLERDDRATILVYPADDPYSYVEVRGTATLEEDPQQDLIEELSVRYLGKACPGVTTRRSGWSSACAPRRSSGTGNLDM